MEYKGDYTVYMHVNKVDGRKYIGITKQSVGERWNNGKNYPVYQAFGEAVYKLGWDFFEHVILNQNVDRELALTLEDFYIKYFKTDNAEYGYNINTNGKFDKKSYEEVIYERGVCVENILNIDKEKFRKFACKREYVCVNSVWYEFLGNTSKPTTKQSNNIGKMLTSLDYMYKSTKPKRVPEYGVSKVWVYMG